MKLSNSFACVAFYFSAPALAVPTSLGTVGQATILYDFNQYGVAAFGWTLQQGTFTATSNQTILQLLVRNDYNDWYFDDISVNRTGTTTNLVSNGDFESMLYYGQCGSGYPKMCV